MTTEGRAVLICPYLGICMAGAVVKLLQNQPYSDNSRLCFTENVKQKLNTHVRGVHAARAKILFLLIKYANLWRPVCRRHPYRVSSPLSSPDCLENFGSVSFKRNCSARYELSISGWAFIGGHFMVPFKRIFKDGASLSLDSGRSRFVYNIQFFLFAKRLSLFYTLRLWMLHFDVLH